MRKDFLNSGNEPILLKNMKCKIAIFDLDGTLLDTLQDLAISANFALEACGYPKRTIEEIRCFVGNGIEKLIERASPADISADDRKKILEIFKLHYADHCEDHTAPYDGIVPLLDCLAEAGISLAVVSNKIDSAVRSLCEKYFGNRFSVAIGEREGIRRKPCPDSVLEVLSETEFSLENAVYIGDSEVDILTARNAGMEAIIVTWGFRDKDFLKASGAKTLVDSVAEIGRLLLGESVK